MHRLLATTDAIFPLQSHRGGLFGFRLDTFECKGSVRSIYNPHSSCASEKERRHLCSSSPPQPSPLVFPLVFTYPFPSAVSKATMYTFPSPPSSPIQHHVEDDDVAAVVCGTCDKPLEKDWFCINCHQRCTTCSRILGQDEHCTRCWAYDTLRNVFVRKPAAALNTPPSPPLTMTAYFPCNSF